MTRTETERHLLALEKQYWKAMKEGDVEAMTRMTDFPCVVAGPQGFMSVDEATYRKMAGQPAYTIDRFSLDDDAQVRMVTDDVAVVAYTVHEELTVEGERVKIDATDTSTWIRRDGRWRCAHHTETLIGDPFGRRARA